jgi:CBS domain-containing protein
MPRIRDIMTADPVSMEASGPIAEAARAMRDNNIGDVLVLDRGQLFGILTDRDIVIRAIAEAVPMTAQVSQICTRSPVRVGPDDAAEMATRMMRQHAIRRLPVVENDVCVGIVSLGDLAEQRDPDSVLANISEARPNH